MRPPRDSSVLGYVVVGGVVGALTRALLLIPFETDAVPWATLAVNVAGSFALAVVVAVLGDRHLHARAFLGTGVLGGFTTYSAFAVEAALWLRTPWLAVALGAASVLLGVVAASAGLAVGRAVARSRGGRP
jgi:CrcB protein